MLKLTFFLFFKFLADTCPFLGPLVPLFWISGDVSSGFQSQSGYCLIRYFCGGECNVHSPRFTSGATLADLLAAGTQPVTSPHACAEVGLGSDSNVQPQEQKTNALPLCQRPGLLKLTFEIPLLNQISFWSSFKHFKAFKNVQNPSKLLNCRIQNVLGIDQILKIIRSNFNSYLLQCRSIGRIASRHMLTFTKWQVAHQTWT